MGWNHLLCITITVTVYVHVVCIIRMLETLALKINVFIIPHIKGHTCRLKETG